jgi:predicted HD phosphohydrolase
MAKQATFTRFDECTKEDVDIVLENHKEFAAGLPDRVLEHLRLLDGDFGGFKVDRLEHSLQTATRAHRDGKDEEYVVCALLHDIGDTLGSYDHGGIAAAILKPFVSDSNHWMLANHPTFQGYPYYEHTREFVDKYDMPAFDQNYESMTLDEFVPMVRRVLTK